MKIIGHRGAKGLAPENTIASFRKALEHGVDEIECDVRITKDDVAILVHDRHLRDPSGQSIKVAEHTLAELEAHKADLTTLEAALREVDRRVPVMIELKPREDTGPVVTLLKQLLKQGWQPKDFLFVSFDYQILQELKKQLPQIDLVVDEMWSGVRASYRARRLGAKRINMFSWWLWGGFIKAMSRSYDLYVFPLNDSKKMLRWKRYGLAGVITDFPDRYEK